MAIRLIEIAVVWILLIAAIWALRRLHGILQTHIQKWRTAIKESRRPDDRHHLLKLMTATQLRAIELWTYRLALIAGFLLLFPAALTFTLQQFPQTEGIAESWINWIRDPLRGMVSGFVTYIPNLAFLLVWSAIVYGLIRLTRLFGRWVSLGLITLPGFHAEWGEPTARILVFLICAFALVVAFPYLPGGNTDAFKGVSIFLGVLISLGSGSAMGNVISGVILTYTRAFRIGDRVKIGEHVGDVMERSLLVTRIRTIKNEDIVMPNSTVMNSSVINYTEGKKSGGLILYTSITIGYDAPWRKVHQLLIDAAMRTDGVLQTPTPFVFQTSLNDYNVAYQINAFTDRPSEMARIYSDLHQHIQDTFNEGGVEILSPMYNSVRDGNHTTIPQGYLPADYQKPGFRVESQ